MKSQIMRQSEGEEEPILADMNKLRGKMVEKSVTVKSLAEALGINAATLYRRLKNPDEFTVGNVKFIAEVLQLTAEEVEYIFA